MSEKLPGKIFIDLYREYVSAAHPDQVNRWPLVGSSGYTVFFGRIFGIHVLIFTGDSSGLEFHNGIGDISDAYSLSELDGGNWENVRAVLYRDYSVLDRGAVVFIFNDAGMLLRELELTMERHEKVMGLFPMKIFLSHKSANKELVREYNETLRLIGFDTWLDEQQMHAGMNIHRQIASGLKDCCAAVFFVTKEFADVTYIAGEIEMAIDRHTSSDNKFRIITLVLDAEATVPTLLQRYLYKQPKTQLEGLREIIRALPIEVGAVRFRRTL